MTKDICIVTKTGLKRVSREIIEPHCKIDVVKAFAPTIFNRLEEFLETNESQEALKEHQG